MRAMLEASWDRGRSVNEEKGAKKLSDAIDAMLQGKELELEYVGQLRTIASPFAAHHN